MRLFAFGRRGARVGFCVLAFGVTAASAQQPAAEDSAAKSNEATQLPATGSENVKPAEPTAPTNATPDTKVLPELVVDGDKKKPAKAAKTKEKATTATTSAGAPAQSEAPPPGVTLGTAAPSDTGTTTFDANSVNLRTDGSGDANTFMRNLPNVQYQNQSGRAAGSGGGATSQGMIDTKPELLSISGGKTYENNFIINGVSTTNITGPTDIYSSDLTLSAPDSTSINGMSPQNMYVPSDFIGTATIIDSNASAEYGQFLGGAVLYDLMAPPTDRYHASVSASRDTSEWASFILASPDGTNPGNLQPPKYEKTNLSASLGAPITSDFAFIAQASRRQAESERTLAPHLGAGTVPEDSDNIFLRFAATAKTDIGKFTLDTSRTDYFQHWEWWVGSDVYQDVNTESAATQLKYETNLTGVRADAVGLGQVKLTSRVFYNTNETQNNSGSSTLWTRFNQRYTTAGVMLYNTNLDAEGWCHDIDGVTAQFNGGALPCNQGGFGNILQGQTDFGVQAALKGDLGFGRFNSGIELKQYEGHRARLEDYKNATGAYVIYNGRILTDAGADQGAAPVGGFQCAGDEFCTSEQRARRYVLSPAYDVTTTLNALHTFAEVDQTWKWFNVRAGVRLDYDDYFDNMNWAPRLAGSVTPIEGVRFTIGYNRYYIGETLYYALRDQLPATPLYTRPANGGPDSWYYLDPSATNAYNTGSLATPYDDEYTAAANIRDPLLGGMFRFKYLERYGDDQFATTICGYNCYAVTNDGDTLYRSASAEYTKEWSGLKNPFSLNAAAITGNVTWSEQAQTKNSYLVSSDLNGDGAGDYNRIYYKGDGNSYRPEAFNAITGNLDIPVRFGATLSTLWFDGALELNATAGINLGFQGVADTFKTTTDAQIGHAVGCATSCNVWDDRKFGATLKLDVSGQINVTEQAAIVFSGTNLTNSDQNVISGSSRYPWVLGRSFYLGSALKF